MTYNIILPFDYQPFPSDWTTNTLYNTVKKI